MSNSDFQFIILKQLQSELPRRYSASEMFPILQSLGTGEALQVLKVDDIAVYDWDRQVITLTGEASQALKLNLEKAESPPEEIKAINRMKESLDWGNVIERALSRVCFTVNLRGTMIYGGIFLDAISQMPIDFPVTRVRLNDQQVQFSILPIHIPFVQTDPVSGSGPEPQLSVAPEARADAQQLDANGDRFSNWIRSIATGETARKFRKVIRDPSLRRMMEKSGKLIN
ncbi:MAG: hypothetical protein U0V70_08600 [Terriglobia bacterium]